jgi:hypothetical protein
MASTRRSQARILTAAIGPLWSHWGSKNWSLLLGAEVVIAYPYTLAEVITLNVRFYLPGSVEDAGHRIRRLAEAGLSLDRLPPRLGIRRYPLYEIRRIELVWSYLRNKIRIVRGQRVDTYAIPHRNQTAYYSQTLKALYPSIYRERNRPQGRLARFLKS